MLIIRQDDILKVLRLFKERRYPDVHQLRSLGIDRRKLEVILGFLLMKGLIREAEISYEKCLQCPIRKICNVQILQQNKGFMKVYIITTKGIRLLESIEKEIR